MSRNFVLMPLSLLFVMLWGSAWVGAKYMMLYAHPLAALTFRYMLVVMCLLTLVTVFKQWRKLTGKEMLHQCTIGILSHTAFLSLALAAMDAGVSAGMVAFITALQPMFTAAISSPITRERVAGLQWVGIAVGAAAAMFVVSDHIQLGGSLAAYSLPFLSMLSITLATLLCRRHELRARSAQRAPAPLLLTLLIHSTAALAGFALLNWKFGSFDANWTNEFVLSIAYMAVVVSIGTYGLMFFLLRKTSAVNVATLMYLTPPAAMLMGWILFNETLSLVDVGGLVAAAIAVCLVVGFSPKEQQAVALVKKPPATQANRSGKATVLKVRARVRVTR